MYDTFDNNWISLFWWNIMRAMWGGSHKHTPIHIETGRYRRRGACIYAIYVVCLLAISTLYTLLIQNTTIRCIIPKMGQSSLLSSLHTNAAHLASSIFFVSNIYGDIYNIYMWTLMCVERESEKQINTRCNTKPSRRWNTELHYCIYRIYI